MNCRCVARLLIEMPRTKQTIAPSTNHLDIGTISGFESSLATVSGSPSTSSAGLASSSVGTIAFQAQNQNGTTTTFQFITPGGYLTNAQQKLIAGTPVRNIKNNIYVTPETTEATEALLLLGTGEQSPHMTPQGNRKSH